MVNFSKFPIEGNCRFPNIFEQLANGSVESATFLGSDLYIENWTIGINVEEIDNEMHLTPFISYKDEFYPKCRIEYYLRIKKSPFRINSKIVLPSGWQAPGLYLKISDLIPELLNDGALIIEYGIRVEAIQNLRYIWNFQLWNDVFDSKGKQVMIQLWKNSRIRCHPQVNCFRKTSWFLIFSFLIKAIHYPIETEYSGLIADIALQIAHGVRIPKYPFQLLWTASFAGELGFRNMIQYCQWQLIQQPFDYSEPNKFELALICNMRSYLVHLIREMNSKDKLMVLLKYLDIDMMSGESMKTFMKFILYD